MMISNIKKVVGIIIKDDRFVLLISINGAKNEISTSKIRNIIAIMMKLVEKEIFFGESDKNPHSKLEGLFFIMRGLSDMWIKIITNAFTIHRVVRVDNLSGIN